MTYFTFHRELESNHEDAMKNAVAAMGGTSTNGPGEMTEADQADFQRGVKAVLDYLEGFWMGLEQGRAHSPSSRVRAAPGTKS